MNLLYAPLMDAPSLTPPWCLVCGAHGSEKHHVVPRSQGGTDGPLLSLCRECHTKAHRHTLHFRYTQRTGWCVIVLPEPTKYQTALEQDGWRRL